MIAALRRRLLYYAVFSVIFGMLYTALVVGVGHIPPVVVWVALGGGVLKDLYDEIRMVRGSGPIAFVGLEHAPSNLVLAAFLYTGVTAVPGSLSVPGLGAVGLGTIATAVAVGDAVWDVSQDLREA